MASSRLEKIGTIFSRVEGLLKSGAMKFEDRPIWYDIYKAFPPKDEPQFSRPKPNASLDTIFYEEDHLRAKLNERVKNIGSINLKSGNKTLSQHFIEAWFSLGGTEFSNEERFEKALKLAMQERTPVVLKREKSTTTRSKEITMTAIEDLFKK